jgi:hypothetical protein
MIVAAHAPAGRAADAEFVHFLTVLSRSVEEALRARKALLSDLVQARREPADALPRVGRASRRCVRAFDDARLRLGRVRTPDPAQECVAELRRWLEAHIEACDLLGRAAAARDRGDLERALRCLADGSLHAADYNRARQRLARRLIGAE